MAHSHKIKKLQCQSVYFSSVLFNQSIYNLTLLPAPSTSASSTILRFALPSDHRIQNTVPIHMTENIIISKKASRYLGLSAGLKKYGLQIFPTCANKHTIDVAVALFSGVSLATLAAQLKIRPVDAKAPGKYRKLAKYRAGRFVVAAEMTKPSMATQTGPTMWSPLSARRSEETATQRATAAARR